MLFRQQDSRAAESLKVSERLGDAHSSLNCSHREISSRLRPGVLGMRQVWSDQAEGSIGRRFPDSDAEIVLHRIASIPAKVHVVYLVDGVSHLTDTG
jgi:hypothetical protein